MTGHNIPGSSFHFNVYASKEFTPMMGIESEKAKPFAVARPTLNPVKEPGPMETAIPANSFKLIPAIFIILFNDGTNIEE